MKYVVVLMSVVLFACGENDNHNASDDTGGDSDDGGDRTVAAPPASFVGDPTAVADGTDADDGSGDGARFGNIIVMRYASATHTLWVMDYNGRVRSIDNDGVVTTRTTVSASAYANLGVDSDGNAYVYDTQGGNVVRKITPDGSTTDTPLTLPESCNVGTLTVGLDDHVYIACYAGSGAQLSTTIVDASAGGQLLLTTDHVSVPTDMVVNDARQFFIADPNNLQLRFFDLETHEKRDMLPSTISGTGAVAIDPSGYVYSTGLKLDADGHQRETYQQLYSYGLAASDAKIFTPECNYTTGWACAVRVIEQ